MIRPSITRRALVVPRFNDSKLVRAQKISTGHAKMDNRIEPPGMPERHSSHLPATSRNSYSSSAVT
jgi:hypothetical protein